MPSNLRHSTLFIVPLYFDEGLAYLLANAVIQGGHLLMVEALRDHT